MGSPISLPLSGKTLAPLLTRARNKGFEINLIYLALPGATTAIERVAARVRQGGHDIPTDVIKRRFHRGLKNLFTLCIPLVNRWKVFHNYLSPPVQIAAGKRTRKLILQEQKWRTLNELAQKA